MPKQEELKQTRIDSFLSPRLAEERPKNRPRQRYRPDQKNQAQSEQRDDGTSEEDMKAANARRSELIDRGRIDSPRTRKLVDVVDETKQVLPGILAQLPNVSATKSSAHYLDRLPPLDAAACPRRTPSGKARVRVVNSDTFNAAIALAAAHPGRGRVAVLNMASDLVPGGGWLHGSMAQEEELCYRSSLHLSLHRRYYPFRRSQALYSPDVVVIRSDYGSGHELLLTTTTTTTTTTMTPADLPVVSVLSVAALRGPRVRLVRTTGGANGEERQEFAEKEARGRALDKMRLTLRMAAHHGHGLLVLGALGCGAFRNPRDDVAAGWLEVLREAEFGGGWWDEIWFAVYDRRGEGNFELFEEVLDGVQV